MKALELTGVPRPALDPPSFFGSPKINAAHMSLLWLEYLELSNSASGEQSAILIPANTELNI